MALLQGKQLRARSCTHAHLPTAPRTHRATQIDMASGDKYYQQVKFENGKMVPGEWAR